MEKYNAILTEKQRNYQDYHQVKLVIMNFLSKEILLSDQRRITGQAKFTYSLLGKAFEKQIKTMENRGIFPKDMKTNEIKNETDEIKKWEEKIKQKYLKYKTKNCTYDF